MAYKVSPIECYSYNYSQIGTHVRSHYFHIMTLVLQHGCIIICAHLNA